MNENQIIKSYEIARERYAELGIDTDKALDTLQKVQLSLHCWQTDDVQGFESAGELTGGIQVNGNYPGKARNIDEVRADLVKVCSLLGGSHRVNLHEIYGEFGGKKVHPLLPATGTKDYSALILHYSRSRGPKKYFFPESRSAGRGFLSCAQW